MSALNERPPECLKEPGESIATVNRRNPKCETQTDTSRGQPCRHETFNPSPKIKASVSDVCGFGDGANGESLSPACTGNKVAAKSHVGLRFPRSLLSNLGLAQRELLLEAELLTPEIEYGPACST